LVAALPSRVIGTRVVGGGVEECVGLHARHQVLLRLLFLLFALQILVDAHSLLVDQACANARGMQHRAVFLIVDSLRRRHVSLVAVERIYLFGTHVSVFKDSVFELKLGEGVALHPRRSLFCVELGSWGASSLPT